MIVRLQLPLASATLPSFECIFGAMLDGPLVPLATAALSL